MEFILKNNIDKSKLLALIDFLKSMNFDFEIRTSKVKPITENRNFDLSVGLWKDSGLTAEQLRSEAWKRK